MISGLSGTDDTKSRVDGKSLTKRSKFVKNSLLKLI